MLSSKPRQGREEKKNFGDLKRRLKIIIEVIKKKKKIRFEAK